MKKDWMYKPCMLYIESKMLELLNYKTMINDFVVKKEKKYKN